MITGYKKFFGVICVSALKIYCAGILVFFETTPARSEPSCLNCHPKEAELERNSVHHQNEVGCADCHGGDPTANEKEFAMSKAAGFRGKIKRTEIPELCGSCHSDVRKMNPYGLPTDQLAQYKTSRHGEALYQENDEHVATCADCHQVHGVLDVRNPESPVYPTNIPSTCGRCHSDPQKMEHHGLNSNQETLYRQSIHAEMLFQKGDLSAPTCVTCHGNHGAVPPGFTEVGLVCGKCHIKQKEFFDQGLHAIPAREGVFDTCVGCHSNHKIVPASEKLFQVCNMCHSEGDRALYVAGKIKEILTRVRKNYHNLHAQVEEAARSGLEIEDESSMLEEAKTYLMQLAPLQHSLNLKRLEEISEKAENILNQAQSRIIHKQKIAKFRKYALIPISLFLALMSFGFWLKMRQMEQQKVQTFRTQSRPEEESDEF